MMRPRLTMSSMNWQHAVGEFVLIVLGILIALWVNDWSGNRRERRTELQLLREMRSALAGDLADNQSDYDAFKEVQTHLLQLSELLQRRAPHTPRVDTLFGALTLGRTMQLNSGPYEVMRGRGFEVISDAELRSQIVHLYGTTYPFMITRYKRNDDFIDGYAEPYFLRNFQGSTRTGSAPAALDYAHVSQDPYLANLVTWHLSDVTFMLTRYEETLAEGKAVLKALDHHIGELQ